MSTEQWLERHYLINDSSIDQSKKPFHIVRQLYFNKDVLKKSPFSLKLLSKFQRFPLEQHFSGYHILIANVLAAWFLFKFKMWKYKLQVIK